MLPSAPKTFGRLSDACLSAFLATIGETNPLALATRKSYALVLVDGMGVANIRQAGGHARFLGSLLKTSKTLFSGFPTTTASSLTSLATGLPNGEHGLLGYRVFDRDRSSGINFLNDLGKDFHPREYQPAITISERAIGSDLSPKTIGPAEYRGSGFTLATMPESEYLSGDSVEERFERAIDELNKPRTFLYVYVPELDQLAHRYGCGSAQWLAGIEAVDAALAMFHQRLPKSAGALVTADHGVIDIPKERHIYLDEVLPEMDLLAVGGDPRTPFIYLKDRLSCDAVRESLTKSLGDQIWITKTEELVSKGWLAPLSPVARKLEPDLILIPRGETVVYHRAFAKRKSLEMVGQHGGISKQEWEVPLLILGS